MECWVDLQICQEIQCEYGFSFLGNDFEGSCKFWAEFAGLVIWDPEILVVQKDKITNLELVLTAMFVCVMFLANLGLDDVCACCLDSRDDLLDEFFCSWDL